VCAQRKKKDPACTIWKEERRSFCIHTTTIKISEGDKQTVRREKKRESGVLRCISEREEEGRIKVPPFLEEKEGYEKNIYRHGGGKNELRLLCFISAREKEKESLRSD